MPRLPERLWGLPVLPVTLQARRAFQGRLLFYACAAFLLFLALRPGEWGDKATIIQAFTAVVLIWATYQSIRRSDDQVEAAQSQIKIAQEQLEASLKAGEAHHLSCSVSDGKGGVPHLFLVNLSTLPIQIERLSEYMNAYDGYFNHNRASRRILKTGESIEERIDILGDSERMRLAKEYADTFITGEAYAADHIVPPDPLMQYNIEVSYRYGGTGSRVYTKVYSIGINNNHNVSSSSVHHPYEFFVYLKEFYYTVASGSGPSRRIHFVHIPDEELVPREATSLSPQAQE